MCMALRGWGRGGGGGSWGDVNMILGGLFFVEEHKMTEGTGIQWNPVVSLLSSCFNAQVRYWLE